MSLDRRGHYKGLGVEQESSVENSISRGDWLTRELSTRDQIDKHARRTPFIDSNMDGDQPPATSVARPNGGLDSGS